MRILTKCMAVIVLAAVPAAAQSASELLQKGIYTQDTVGDLGGAIQIYRQIISSSPAQHEIAAEAQYRLAQALIRKGDLTGAALEFQTLARDYSEYQALISRMAAPGRGAFVYTPAAANAAEFNSGTSLIFTGTVTQVQWMMPRSWVHVKTASGIEWSVALASIPELAAQQWTRDAVKLGDEISVTGSSAKDGSYTALADTVLSATGKLLFSRANIAQTTPAQEDLLKMKLQQAEAVRHLILEQSGIIKDN
jgi:hypothetical protein